jgi:HK97 family phage portal protein
MRLSNSTFAVPEIDVTAAVAEMYPVNPFNLGYNPDLGYLQPVSRRAAMTVPAVARARTIIAGTIASLELYTYLEATEAQIPNRPVIKQPDPGLARSTTVVWTIDDLIFYGVAYWQILAVSPDDGRVTQARRIDPIRISTRTDSTGQLILAYTLDGQDLPMRGVSSLITFWGPDEGVLARGSRTINAAIELEAAALRMAQEPVPQMVIRNEGMNLPADQKEALLTAFKSARRTRSTAYVEGPINLDVVGLDSAQMQLTEARAYTASEIARVMNIPAWYINAESATSTYSNVSAERRSLIDFSLRPYLDSFESRLSMDDITPRGQYVEVHLDDFLRGNPTERVDIIIKLLTAGIINIDEARAMEDLAPRGSAPVNDA